MADNDRRSLDEVLARFLDGDPEPSDGERLAEAMRGDPDFAQEVVRLLTVDDLLRQCAVPDDLAFLESLKLRLNGECGGDEFAGEFERRLRSRDERNRSGRPWLSWTVAAAACVATLVIGGLIARRPGAEPLPAQPPLQHQSVAGDSAAPVSRAPATPGGLAMVVKLDDVLWVPREGPHPSEGELVASGRLQFRSGRITLSMLTGVVLVVEGPADFELVALDKVYCRRGRIRARVPKGAEGFVVASAASAVIDLGTEFALNVEADGKSRVMVFEGLAEAALLDAAGSPKRTQLVTKSKEFELDPGKDRIAESVARPEDLSLPQDDRADAGTRHRLCRDRDEIAASGLLAVRVAVRQPGSERGPRQSAVAGVRPCPALGSSSGEWMRCVPVWLARAIPRHRSTLGGGPRVRICGRILVSVRRLQPCFARRSPAARGTRLARSALAVRSHLPRRTHRPRTAVVE